MCIVSDQTFQAGNVKYCYKLNASSGLRFISPTHKRTEGRAPVWGSEFTSKTRRTTGRDPAETVARLNVKLWLLTGGVFLLLIKAAGKKSRDSEI